MQFGFIPNLCYVPTVPNTGSGQTVDLLSTLEAIRSKINDVIQAILDHDAATGEDHTELMELLENWRTAASNPVLLPSEITELLTSIREHLAEVKVQLPTVSADLVDMLRENSLKVVTEFQTLNTQQSARHTQLLDKLSLKKVIKRTRFKFVDASQYKVTINLPEGALSWTLYPVCQEGDQLVQDVAHTYSINGENFAAGEIAGDEAKSMGNTIAVLEGREFVLPAKSGRFRFAWAYSDNMPIGPVTQTVDDDSPAAEVLDTGTAIDAGTAVESSEEAPVADGETETPEEPPTETPAAETGDGDDSPESLDDTSAFSL